MNQPQSAFTWPRRLLRFKRTKKLFVVGEQLSERCAITRILCCREHSAKPGDICPDDELIHAAPPFGGPENQEMVLLSFTKKTCPQGQCAGSCSRLAFDMDQKRFAISALRIARLSLCRMREGCAR